MGDDENPISRVLACNIVQRVMHPPGEDSEAFTLFWQGEFELTLGETMIELGVLVLGFGVGQALEQTVVTLTQAFLFAPACTGALFTLQFTNERSLAKVR